MTYEEKMAPRKGKNEEKYEIQDEGTKITLYVFCFEN